MNYNDILRQATSIALEERKTCLTVEKLKLLDSADVIEHLENELKPEYMNTEFTWAQIKRALEKNY